MRRCARRSGAFGGQQTCMRDGYRTYIDDLELARCPNPLVCFFLAQNRTDGAKQKPLTLRPGSIKKLLRRIKLPREFAVHRTALPVPSVSSSSPAALRPDVHSAQSPILRLSFPVSPGSHDAQNGSTEKQPAPHPVVDSPADWLCVFDTEFSPNMAIKIRTTRQIPVSGAKRCLKPG